jgi:hypothetical protein
MLIIFSSKSFVRDTTRILRLCKLLYSCHAAAGGALFVFGRVRLLTFRMSPESQSGSALQFRRTCDEIAAKSSEIAIPGAPKCPIMKAMESSGEKGRVGARLAGALLKILLAGRA